MCSKDNCPHYGDLMCSCLICGTSANEIIADLKHFHENILEAKWELEYTNLDNPENRRLCLVGTCRCCGNRLCTVIHITENLPKDDFLAEICRHVFLFSRNVGLSFSLQDFEKMFVALFHEEDQSYIWEWLEHKGNRYAAWMYGRTKKTEEQI